jgi:CubicO group peptidase (beta-lactamase class C family)
MRSTIRISSLTVCLALCLHAFTVAQLQDIRDEIGKIIRYESGIDFDIVPGLVIGVWDRADTAYFTFGTGVESDDWFEVGSLTKPITAHFIDLALAELGYERTTSICTFLPDSICRDRWNEISVQQILEHQAGLPRQPVNMGLIETTGEDPYHGYDRKHLAKDMNDSKPHPGRYSYSHIGYAALHWVFDRVGGLTAFANNYLDRSDREMLWLADDESLAPGFGFDGKPAVAWHTNAMQPALGLRSTIHGMVEFIMQQQGTLAWLHPVLSPELKRELASCDKYGGYKVTKGWFIIRSGKSIVFYHNGRTGGHHASAAFMPAEQKGVVVFSNGTAGSNDLSLSILTMLRRAKRKS